MKKIEISKEELLPYVSVGMLRKDICNELHISWTTLNKLLKQYDLILPSYGLTKGKEHSDRQHPEINKEWLIENWVNTPKSIKQLAEDLQINDSLIESRITFYNLKKPTKYITNLDKLFNLQDPQIYYIAGLIATDGYLPNDSDSFDIELSGDSEYILLNNLLHYLESNSKIFNYNQRHLLSITAIGLQQFLIENFGLTKVNKTFNVTVPKYFPNEACVRGYILGCLDGDGYISKKLNKIALTTASENLVTGLIDLVVQYSGINFHYYIEKRKSGNFPSMQLVSKNRIKQFLDWLYQDNLICLERKKDIYINNMEGGDINEVN